MLVLVASLLGLGGIVALAGAGPDSAVPQGSATASGRLYFTTFHPPTVDAVDFSYRAKRLRLSKPSVVAHLPGADGVLFGPDGHLLVGGVHTGNVFSIDPTSGAVTAMPAGIPASMHLTLSPDGRTLYTSGEPGRLVALPLSPPGPGRVIRLHGATTQITALAFGPHGQVLYTDSNPLGRGSIGLVNLATGLTRRLFANVVGAHGIVYDPWTDAYLVVGGDVALQLAASDPHRIESEVVLRNNRFDQAAVTGRGQVLIASNLGKIVLIDYSKSGRIGDVANTVDQVHLAHFLDDVAPLIGPGARPVPTSAHLRRLAGGGAIGMSALLAGASGVVWERRRKRRRRLERPRARPLPRWDRRRRSP